MKKSDMLSDAIGRVDQKYVSEYITAGTAARRPHRRRGALIAAIAAVLVAAMTFAIVPVLRRDSSDPQLPQIPDIDGLSYELLTDANGNRYLHAVNSYLDTDAVEAWNKLYSEKRENETAYAWDINIDTARNSTSPNSLIFSGIPIRTDTYCFDDLVECTEDGSMVSYDVATKTTSVYTMSDTDSKTYTRNRRTVCSIISVQITDIYKKSNTTGYNIGDVIYLYTEYSYFTHSIVADSGVMDELRIDCAGAGNWGNMIGDELVFIVWRGDNAVSESVCVTGVISDTDKMWRVSASCSIEAYKSGNYYQGDQYTGPDRFAE